MPLIIRSYDVPPDAFLRRFRDLTVSASVDKHISCRIDRGRTVTIAAGRIVPDAITIDRGRTFSAFGRLNDDANKFGAATLPRGRTDVFAASRKIKAKAIFPRGRDLEVIGRVQSHDSDTLSIFLTITDPATPGLGDTLSARIIADGITYEIKSYAFSAGSDNSGVSVNCILLKPTDRAVLEAADVFTFDLYKNGSWRTMFTGGVRSGLGFAFSDLKDGKPTDNLSVSSNGQVSAKLEKSPANNLTVYDPARVQVAASDFRTIFTTDGIPYDQDLHAIAAMDLFALLRYVFVTKCGFTDYKTTLPPNYPIRRADFEITDSFYSGIAPHVGMFSPLLFVRDDVVWLLDSTAGIPAGFPAPFALTADKYIDAQFTDTALNADGFIVEFSDVETDYDYTTTNEVIDDPETSGEFGDPGYMETVRVRTYRSYFKTSNPFVPVRVDKIIDITTVSANVGGTFLTVSIDREDASFDTFGHPSSIHRDLSGRIPDIATTGFPLIFPTLIIEDTRFNYTVEHNNSRRKVLSKVVKEERGLISVDNETLHLGRPFKQCFVEAMAAGNLKSGLATEFGAIRTSTETHTQLPAGETEVRTRIVNFLTNPAQTTGSTTDARGGDGSVNGQTGATGQVIVFRTGATRTDAKMQVLSVGELPSRLAINLARRILARRTRRRGNITLLGLNLDFDRGTMFELFDRDGFSVGNFVVEGFSIQANNLGTSAQKTRQVLEVVQL